jgi:hypothetical protein
MNEEQTITLKVGELKALIVEAVQNAIAALPSVGEEALLVRKEVAAMFRISLVTLNEWMNEGLLPYYAMNRRIYFKKSEVISALERFRKIGRKNDDSTASNNTTLPASTGRA